MTISVSSTETAKVSSLVGVAAALNMKVFQQAHSFH